MKYNDIRKLLPQVYQRSLVEGKPLDALLHVMQSLFAPAEGVLERIDTYFGPYTAPERFVQYLAKWVDLDRYLNSHSERLQDLSGASPISIESGRLRELIAKAAQLSQWRGTARGLKLFLETATGVSGFVLQENTVQTGAPARAFHLHIRAPQAAQRYQQLITTIINGEKPAYVTYQLEFTEG